MTTLEPLWTSQELLRALQPVIAANTFAEYELEGLGSITPGVAGIAFDSRQVVSGDLFIALAGDPGPRFNASQRSTRDGHEYVEAAIAQGASVVLVRADWSAPVSVSKQACFIPVTDTLDALWQLARYRRAQLNCPVVAITGSSGKTTCKTLLSAVLGAHSSQGSFNNHLGVPVSLARTPRTAPSAVFEIGTNHEGEIAPLSQLVAPTIAVVLNVHSAHIENFDSRDALIDEKLSIAQGLATGGGGTLIVEDTLRANVPADATAHTLSFGLTVNADVRLLALEEEVELQFAIADQEHHAHVPGGGEHRALCLLACAAVLHCLDRPLTAMQALGDDLVPAGRGNIVDVAGVRIIDDSYNANPQSMAAALTRAGSLAVSGRRYAVVGEMLELGAQGERAHRDLAQYCVAFDQIFCVGNGMQRLHAALDERLRAGLWAEADDALLTTLVDRLQPGDLVVVKGSNRVFWHVEFVQRLTRALPRTSDDTDE